MLKNDSSVKPPLKVRKSYELPVYITGSMQILDRFSSKLALRFALKLFFTPLRFSRPQRELAVHDASRKVSLKTQTGEEFVLHQWGQQGERVLLVHGWSGRGTQFLRLIETLLETGYQVVAIDAPAHGDSPKKRQTNLLEFVNSTEETCRQFGPFSAAIGHSLGGAAILNTLDRNIKIPKIVTVGTPSSVPNVVRDFCEKVKARPKLAQAILKHIESSFNVHPSEVSPDYLVKKYRPTGMVVHDKMDVDVSVEEAHLLHASWPNAKLNITSGLGHRKVLNDQKVISEIMNFIHSV